MRLLALLTPLLVIAISSCATTSAPTQENEPVVAEKAVYPGEQAEMSTDKGDQEPDVICKMVKKTGSNIKKKVCTTRAEREAMRRSAEDFVRKAQRGARTGNE